MNPVANASDDWFVIDLVEKIFEGPFTLNDLKQNLAEQKIFWSDLAMCPGKNFAWVRIFEIKELVDLCPPLPSPDLLKHFSNVAFRQQSYVKLPVALPVGVKTVGEPNPIASPPLIPNTIPLPQPMKQKIRVRTRTHAAAIELARPSAITEAVPRAAGPAEWHLLIDDNEVGPFTISEIESAFKQGKRPDRAYVWRKSMKRWKPIGLVPEMKHLNASSYGADFVDEKEEHESSVENYQNLRRAFRKNFIASVVRISEAGIKQMIGVCGNITLEGLHLHQDSFRVEYPIGSRHTLEIKPIKLSKLVPFRVVAVVRWVDSESYGIGFQFTQVSPDDLNVLKYYLETEAKK